MLNKAEAGRLYWMEHCLDNYDRVLLIPDHDIALQSVILAAFINKLDRIRAAGKQVKTIVMAITPLPPSNQYETLTTTVEEADDLVALYSMYEFTDKLIIASFDSPSGRKLRNLMHSGIAAKEELINDVIWGWLDGGDV